MGFVGEARNEVLDTIEDGLDEIGLIDQNNNNQWIELDKITSKQAYSIILQQTYKLDRLEKQHCNAMQKRARRHLTAAEQDYWFRIYHGQIQSRSELSKWAKNKEGELVNNTCGMCKTEKDTRKHKFYACKMMQELITKLERVYVAFKQENDQEWARPNFEQWQLQAEENQTVNWTLTIIIAKVRYLYHVESGKVYSGKKNKLDTDIVIERLGKALRLTLAH